MANQHSHLRPLAYQAVNCEFHDVLESVATLRKRVAIEVQIPGGVRSELSAMIVDVFCKADAEYIALDTGEVIRLDDLIAVDGISAKKFDLL